MPVVLWYPATEGSGRPGPYLHDRDLRREVLDPELARAADEVRPYARANAGPASSPGGFPLILLSHALGGLPSLYTALSEDLASRGYVVAALGHPGDGAPMVVDGRVVTLSAAWEENDPSRVGPGAYLSFREARVRSWVDDALRVLAGLPAEVAGGRTLGEVVDTTRVLYLGHSIGGSAAALGCAVSPAFDACANLDGWPLPSRAASGLRQPYLHVEETRPYRSDAQLEEWRATRAEYDRNMQMLAAAKDSVFQAADSASYHLVVDGLSHQGFTDRPLWSPAAADAQEMPAERAAAVLRAWVGWFADAHLREDSSARPPAPRAFPEVRFTAYGASWSQDRPEPRD